MPSASTFAGRPPHTVRRCLPVALVLALSAPPSAAQEPLAGFADYVAAGVEAWEVPGLAVAVVKDGELVFARGFGQRQLGGQDPVTVETLFAIGSTTKAMTAAALGMLVDEGKLNWDDRVTEHLPDFELADPYATREVRVRDLLTHRAGLGNADYLWYEQETTPEEILHRIRYAEPAYSLRAGFIYQNIMYAAAGQVVAEVSGVPWADFVQTRIFGPLGMKGAVPTMAARDRGPDVAAPHYRIDGTVEVIENASVDPIAPAGAIWAGVEDMSRWMRFLLAVGVTEDGERLLSEETLAELFTPQAMVGPDQFYPTARLTKPHWTTYGLGWFQHDYQGRAVDFHTGSIDGMVAIIGLIRDENLGVYVLANLDHAELRHALMYRVFDAFGHGPSRDWSAELLELYGGFAAEGAAARVRAEKARVEGTIPTLDPVEWAGTYTDRLYGTVEVTADGAGGLRFVYGPGLQGPLEHWNYDTFRVTWEARWRGTSLVSFRLDNRGRPASLEINGSVFTRRAEED